MAIVTSTYGGIEYVTNTECTDRNPARLHRAPLLSPSSTRFSRLCHDYFPQIYPDLSTNGLHFPSSRDFLGSRISRDVTMTSDEMDGIARIVRNGKKSREIDFTARGRDFGPGTRAKSKGLITWNYEVAGSKASDTLDSTRELVLVQVTRLSRGFNSPRNEPAITLPCYVVNFVNTPSFSSLPVSNVGRRYPPRTYRLSLSIRFDSP